MPAKYLTDLGLEKYGPRKVRREIADAGLTGLYFVIQPSGAKTWALRYRYAGAPRKLTLGVFPAIDLDKARQRAADALEAVSQGRDPCAEKRYSASIWVRAARQSG